MKEYVGEIALALTTGLFSFFAGRKTKRNSEQSGELENIERVRAIEKALLIDMEEQIVKMIQTNNTLEAIIDRQAKKIRLYKKRYGDIELEK